MMTWDSLRLILERIEDYLAQLEQEQAAWNAEHPADRLIAVLERIAAALEKPRGIEDYLAQLEQEQAAWNAEHPVDPK